MKQGIISIVGLLAVSVICRIAQAEEPLAPSASPAPSTKVGGHVGIALPLVTVSSKTTTISDNVTILDPIGVSVKMSPHWVIDFETVVATPAKPTGGST